jgi:hypothetical protein
MLNCNKNIIVSAFKIVAGWVTPKGWLTQLQLCYSIRIHETILKAPIIVVLCCTFIFYGCIESKYPLNITSTLNERPESFLQQLPGIGKMQYAGMAVKQKATAVQVYAASFKEMNIEKDNLLEVAEFNTGTKRPTANYLQVDGFMQNLYLLKYNFNCKSGSDELPVVAVVFLSFKYRQEVNGTGVYCTGPGPAYWGVVNDGYISFDSVVNINKAKGSRYYLKMAKHKRNQIFNLLFMPANFSDAVPVAGSFLNFTKIVRMGTNRIGGVKPVVFNIPEIFKDSNALRFNYVKSVSLNK